jgi:hypothetical protein
VPEGIGYSIYLRPTAISTYVRKGRREGGRAGGRAGGRNGRARSACVLSCALQSIDLTPPPPSRPSLSLAWAPPRRSNSSASCLQWAHTTRKASTRSSFTLTLSTSGHGRGVLGTPRWPSLPPSLPPSLSPSRLFLFGPRVLLLSFLGTNFWAGLELFFWGGLGTFRSFSADALAPTFSTHIYAGGRQLRSNHTASDGGHTLGLCSGRSRASGAVLTSLSGNIPPAYPRTGSPDS